MTLTALVLRLLVFMLLVVAGDVERNPGPEIGKIISAQALKVRRSIYYGYI